MRNLGSSLKKEWLELTRTKKIYLYVLVLVICLLSNWTLAILNVPVHNTYTDITCSMQSRYGVISGMNVTLLTVYVVMSLFIARSVVTAELKSKKLVQPFAMGLSASANIVAKYIVQAVIPSFMACLAVILNGVIAFIVFPNGAFYSIATGAMTVDFGVVLISGVCVFAMALLYMVLLISVSAFFKNALVGLTVSLVVLLIGLTTSSSMEIAVYMPDLLRLTAMKLSSAGTASQYVFSSVVTAALIMLLTISATVVYTDRNDVAI